MFVGGINVDLAQYQTTLLRPSADQMNVRFIRGIIDATTRAFIANRHDYALGVHRQVCFHPKNSLNRIGSIAPQTCRETQYR